jgi:hypothetical protein
MATKKKKSNVKKVLLGATAVAAVAGVAALASNKKVRSRVTKEAGVAFKKAKADPRVKQVGKEAGSLVSKLGQVLGGWFK